MTKSPAQLRLESIEGDALESLVHAAGLTVPIEQALVWEAFDAAVAGRSPWGRLAAYDEHDNPVAVMALSEYPGRGFSYLWAKHGPVWLEKPTPDAERALRRGLVDHIGAHAPRFAFVRLHTHHDASDLRPLLQTVTYDRTVVVDVRIPAEEYLASLSKKFRYTVRQALKHDDIAVADETEEATADFGELHAIYLETAERDGFGIFDAEVYRGMLEALAPHARVFVARRTGGDDERGRAIAWAIVTDYDGAANYVYAGANREAREVDATVRLLWEVLEILRTEGIRTFDMGGVDSERAPSLAGVGLFKRKWGAESEVDPAWDVPVKPMTYRVLTWALKAKRLLRGRR